MQDETPVSVSAHPLQLPTTCFHSHTAVYFCTEMNCRDPLSISIPAQQVWNRALLSQTPL